MTFMEKLMSVNKSLVFAQHLIYILIYFELKQCISSLSRLSSPGRLSQSAMISILRAFWCRNNIVILTAPLYILPSVVLIPFCIHQRICKIVCHGHFERVCCVKRYLLLHISHSSLISLWGKGTACNSWFYHAVLSLASHPCLFVNYTILETEKSLFILCLFTETILHFVHPRASSYSTTSFLLGSEVVLVIISSGDTFFQHYFHA